MIMWELMTGRKPFWDHKDDRELMINLHDGLRPPIVTNAPKDYVKLMQECWNSDPDRRPTANNICQRLTNIRKVEINNPTDIIKSPDIGPVLTNNPGAIYKSRSLSAMIESAESTRSLKSRNIISSNCK